MTNVKNEQFPIGNQQMEEAYALDQPQPETPVEVPSEGTEPSELDIPEELRRTAAA